ncbi:MAG: hemerythrin domain-containing protein [Sterolibacterium sp.]|jgi:hemerythrin-like domain-containing protein|nr:hemerythrin domain-containing protein [Sterolibacterium sp.]
MKRSTALTSLSREHHTALVLAKQAQRLAHDQPESPAVQMFMSALKARFSSELEPHFQVEETTLLRALEENTDMDTEARALARRTRHEHEALRALAQRVSALDFSSLAPFGELLAAHVRFEERELFDRAESLLSVQQLACVAAASAMQSHA